ncbi:DUF6314 family protein [Streptomyces tendae]|uniref:DUF6314 family protein n=1 Tax=Streptomyces tendae TaxID=1932 RepID=UPI0024929832|nr:DUF6314 family protein [Streptomyces tendae]
MGELWPVPDVLAYLAGRWRTERSVRDLASGLEGRFEGTTSFDGLGDAGPDGRAPDGRAPDGGALDGGGLISREQGHFTWQGVTRPAERTLRYEPGTGPGRADVRFADGRPFHGLDLTTGHHVADHPCAADLYRGEFTVRGPDRWRTVWRVGGPAKDLLLTTDYLRETPQA